ncbi:MAG TPA: nuclear transport factor 2 family protein [Baekduia sp.]|jgi:ketosteroid isomerase-like protein|nr:nuclear transport factor 2 family protein [Baekduia sp.]
MSLDTNNRQIDAKLEPLRRLHAALSVSSLFNAGRTEELAELVHPDVTVLSVPGVAPGAGYAGRDGLLRYFDEAAEHGFVAHAAITEAHVTQAGNVLACGSLLSTVHDVTNDVPAWFVYRFREEMVSAIETYLDADTAREQARRPSVDTYPVGSPWPGAA